MTTTVFVAVVFAAMLHATWNAVVKGGRDKTLSMAAIVLGHAPFALAVLPFVPMPAPESWPLVVVSTTLHLGYQFFLIWSYRTGDLTQVYPLARGSAPLIVAVVSVGFLGVMLERVEIAGVVIIALGIVSLGLVRQKDGLRNPAATRLALVTGCFIASYSLVDGIGARQAGTALGFYGWSTILNAIVTAIILLFYDRSILRRLPPEGGLVFVVGGGASYLAYALVVWSFTQAPIALVTALRETSIIFALLIGVFVLKERLSLMKVASTAVVLGGVALMRFGRSG